MMCEPGDIEPNIGCGSALSAEPDPLLPQSLPRTGS